MARCEFCALLDIDVLRVTYKHHDSLQDLKDCAETQECDLCLLFWTSIKIGCSNSQVEECLQGRPSEPEHQREVTIYLDPFIYDYPPGLAHQIGEGAKGSHIVIICGPFPLYRQVNGLSNPVAVFAEPGTTAADFLIERDTTTTQDARLRIDISKQWLLRCRRFHPDCGDTPLELFITQGRVGRYAALSYSWGEGVRHKVKLKTATLSSLQQEIPEADLTLSHREALQVARELGYRYIWIDAFGIIQDDKDDWAKQSVQIADVYGNAEVTIVAGRSDNSIKGFLDSTYTPQLSPVAIPYIRPNSDVPEGSCYIGLERKSLIGPVDKRAWCFQESVLSRRMIVYGEQQLKFLCRKSMWQEDGRYSNYKWGVNGRFDISPESLLDPNLGKGTVLKRWYELAILYSIRELYDPTDNFATISGIAIRFQKALNCRYLAGLWEDDMVFGLLWRSRRLLMGPHSQEALRKPIGVTKATKGMEIVRAPSWSWLALKGPVWYYGGRDRERKFQDSTTFRCKPADPNGVRWSPDDWNPSIVANLPLPCRLGVLGYIQKVRVSDTKPAEYLKRPKLGNQPGKRNRNTVLLEKLDRGAAEVSTATSQDEIVAMGLFDTADGNPMSLWVMCLLADEGLMLEKNSDGYFSRLGIFVVQDEDWFAQQKEEKVVLI